MITNIVAGHPRFVNKINFPATAFHLTFWENPLVKHFNTEDKIRILRKDFRQSEKIVILEISDESVIEWVSAFSNNVQILRDTTYGQNIHMCFAGFLQLDVRSVG